MLKFFYRVRRQRGVVLFVVIAVMTLLIAMATTAYYTARSSYQTVVSNYDFSQLYLSTTSISDMIIGALTQSTSRSDVTGTTEASPTTSVKLNDYSKLKEEIQNIKTTALNQVKGGSTLEAAVAASKPLVGYSHNMQSAKDGTTEEMLMAAAARPVEAGVIDGVKVTIKLEKMVEEKSVTGTPTGRYEYYFTVTTTGFYRNNTVTVQDSMYNISGTIEGGAAPSFNSFFKSTGGSDKLTKGERAVVIGAELISDNAYFENTYTIFTELSGGNNVFLGGVTATGSVYFSRQANTIIPPPGYVWKKEVHLSDITDDGAGGKKFVSGSFSDWAEAKADARHDWFINGNLGLMSENAGTIDLNGNNLYVNGDLIIGNQDKGVKAHNIYVNGNIYFTNGSGKITLTDDKGNYVAPGGEGAGALYCKGNVYVGDPNSATEMPISHDDGSWNAKYGTSWTKLSDEWTDIKARINSAAAEAGSGTAISDYATGSYSNISGRITNSNTTLYCNGTVSSYLSGLTKKTTPYDPTATTVTISTLTENDDNDGYVYKSSSMTIDKVFDSDTGVTATQEWPVYTAKDETLANVLTIDMKNAPKLDSGMFTMDDTGKYQAGQEVTFTCEDGTTGTAITGADNTIKYEFKSTGGQTAVVYKDGNYPIVDIPYCASGYTLNWLNPDSIRSLSDNGNRGVTVNIGTEKDKTTPIVLAANMTDKSGTATDENGYNAFSWTGTNPWSSDGKAVKWEGGIAIQLVTNESTSSDLGSKFTTGAAINKKKNAEGNVIFELGNYETDGGYVAYNSSSTETATFRIGENTLIGTMAQVQQVCGASPDQYKGFSTQGKVDPMYENGSDPKAEFENRVMIVSNKNTSDINTTGDSSKTKAGVISDTNLDTLICGYIYSPNATYVNPTANNKVPIFGGLIVSEYVTGIASYKYAEPNPSIIEQLLSGLKKPGGGGGGGGSAEGTWYLSGPGIGRNYLG